MNLNEIDVGKGYRLLEDGEIIQVGDDKWNGKRWEPTFNQTVGVMEAFMCGAMVECILVSGMASVTIINHTSGRSWRTRWN